MEPMQWLTLIVFGLTILAVITNVIDSTLAALVGVAVMCWMGIMTETDAFKLRRLERDGDPGRHLDHRRLLREVRRAELALDAGAEALRRAAGLLVIILTFLAGVISMFVDNVVTILMMAPVALPLAQALKLTPVPVILMIGFGANFMGTALIIGDLPPQMLHSVAGAEFFDFIWHQGRPSSFPILMVTFLITLGVHVVRTASAGTRA